VQSSPPFNAGPVKLTLACPLPELATPIVTTKLMGLIPSVVFGGIMTLILVGTTAKMNPVLCRCR